MILVKLNCISANNELRTRVISLATTLLEDGHITVRQKAAKILGGLLHSGFVCDDTLTELLARLRSKVRTKMTRKGRKFKKETQQLQPASDREKVTLHSGILGLCAFVEAFPYDVPSFLPPILMELSTHLNDPQVGIFIIILCNVTNYYMYFKIESYCSLFQWLSRKHCKNLRERIKTTGRQVHFMFYY